LATRIGVIHQGKLLQEHGAKELHNLLIRKLIVDTPNNTAALEFLDQRSIKSIIGMSGKLEISYQPLIEKPEELNTMLVNESLPPKEIYVHEESLEDYFLRIVHSSR
jgi:ABC-type multidrug transport system ATPase subunit